MRPLKQSLLALIIAVVATAFAAGTASAAPPVLTAEAPSGITTSSVTFNGTINTGGILSIPRVYYFKPVVTTNCSFPNAGEAAGAAYASESDNLHQTTGTDAFQITVNGLSPGSTYCWYFNAVNYAGAASSTAWTSVKTLNGPNAPEVHYTGDGATAHTIHVSGEVSPHGLDFSYHVDYFPQVQTANCNFPNLADLVNVVSTPSINSTDHAPVVPVGVTITSLPDETNYCARLVAKNADGEDASLYWLSYTLGDNPVLGSQLFDGGSTTIEYAGSFTPNSNLYFAYIRADYFKKTGVACNEYTGAVTERPYYNEDFDGWSGDSQQGFSSEITGLQTDTTYCIRLVAVNAYGDDTGPWSEAATVQPRPVEITNTKLGPSIGADQADITFDLNDRGAADDIGDPSKYSLYVFDVGAGRCTSADYFGGAQLVDENNIDFSGQDSITYGLNGLTAGKPYCVTIVTDSAWGDEFDTTTHTEVWFGSAPQSLGANFTVEDWDSLSGEAYFKTGGLATSYGVEFFVKQAGVTCAADTTTPRQTVTVGTVTTELTVDKIFYFPVDDFVGSTTYCLDLILKNYWGEDRAGTFILTTPAQPQPATVSNIAVGPPELPGEVARISADLDDGGSGADSGSNLDYEMRVYEVGASSCNLAGVTDVTPIGSSTGMFTGSKHDVQPLDALVSGTSYCIRYDITSNWSGMDAHEYKAFVMPGTPAISEVSTSVTADSASISGTLAPTWTTTVYDAEWYSQVGSGDCVGAGITTRTGTSSASGAQAASDLSISIPVIGLDPEEIICIRFNASNDFGSTSTAWEQAVIPEITPPSVPTGLSSSAVTRTTALLSWLPSTDNFGVDRYVIKADGIVYDSSQVTSISVVLSCGVATNFTVSAVDAAGNESDDSASFVITGAACPVVVQPPVQTPAAPQKTCFAPFKKTVKGKLKSKKKFSVTITATPSVDGQSITVVAKAKGVIAGIVVAKKSMGKKATVTSPDGVTVTYKVGKKKKTVKVALTRAAC